MSGPGMFVSTKATDAAILADCPTPQAKLLLVILAAMVDGHLQCFPSLAVLARRSGIKSERTVQAHLAALADAQLLRIEADEAPNGRRTSNVYTVLLTVEGAKPAEPLARPRRRHPHSFKRPRSPGDKPVGKSVERRSDTPQILRGHPAGIAGTVPADFAGLEPRSDNQEAHAPARVAATIPRARDGRPVTGRRYALPAPDPRTLQVSEPEEPAEGLARLAERLRARAPSR